MGLNLSVGLYSSATRISEVWYFIPTAIVSSVGPSIYQAKKNGNDSRYYQIIAKLLKILNIIAISIALPTTFVVQDYYSQEQEFLPVIIGDDVWKDEKWLRENTSFFHDIGIFVSHFSD